MVRRLQLRDDRLEAQAVRRMIRIFETTAAVVVACEKLGAVDFGEPAEAGGSFHAGNVCGVR